jgi:hypothetical protein
MENLAENLPLLDKIVQEIEELAESGGKYAEAPHVIEVTLPMLCSYLPFWWCRGPDSMAGEKYVKFYIILCHIYCPVSIAVNPLSSHHNNLETFVYLCI